MVTFNTPFVSTVVLLIVKGYITKLMIFKTVGPSMYYPRTRASLSTALVAAPKQLYLCGKSPGNVETLVRVVLTVNAGCVLFSLRERVDFSRVFREIKPPVV